MGAPATSETRVWHDRVAVPARLTVQAPHWPIPHPNLVPVSCRWSRSTQSSGVSAGALTVCLLPLTVRTYAGMGDSPGSSGRGRQLPFQQYFHTWAGDVNVRIVTGAAGADTPRLVPGQGRRGMALGSHSWLS